MAPTFTRGSDRSARRSQRISTRRASFASAATVLFDLTTLQSDSLHRVLPCSSNGDDRFSNLARLIRSDERQDVLLLRARESQCPAAATSGKQAAIGPCESSLLRARACPTRRNKAQSFVFHATSHYSVENVSLENYPGANIFYDVRSGDAAFRLEISKLHEENGAPCSLARYSESRISREQGLEASAKAGSRLDVEERSVGVGEGDRRCDTLPWSTFVPIVQECRSLPLSLPLYLSVALSFLLQASLHSCIHLRRSV